MKKPPLLWPRLLAAMLFLLANGTDAFAAPPPRLDDPLEGEKLARHLRSMGPAEETQFRGTLRLSAPRTAPREVPITSRAIGDDGDWVSTYTARLPDGGSEVLSIRHSREKPGEYTWTRGDQVLKLNGNEATNRFAGSDFALVDLGMEFLHWPKQILVTREMRKGRGCDVLESRPAQPGPYGRVVSWIDQETSGLLIAEASDAAGKPLKEFEVKGFKKVAGQWQVQEMEIRNRQTKTSTRLQFHFDKE